MEASEAGLDAKVASDSDDLASPLDLDLDVKHFNL
jgi:hypothetical protein